MSNLIKIRYTGIGTAEKEHGTIANHKKGNPIPDGWVVVESEGWDGVSADEDLSCGGKYMVFHYNIVLDRLKKKLIVPIGKKNGMAVNFLRKNGYIINTHARASGNYYELVKCPAVGIRQRLVKNKTKKLSVDEHNEIIDKLKNGDHLYTTDYSAPTINAIKRTNGLNVVLCSDDSGHNFWYVPQKKDAPIIYKRQKTRFMSNPVVVHAPEPKTQKLTQTKAGFFV